MPPTKYWMASVCCHRLKNKNNSNHVNSKLYRLNIQTWRTLGFPINGISFKSGAIWLNSARALTICYHVYKSTIYLLWKLYAVFFFAVAVLDFIHNIWGFLACFLLVQCPNFFHNSTKVISVNQSWFWWVTILFPIFYRDLDSCHVVRIVWFASICDPLQQNQEQVLF